VSVDVVEKTDIEGTQKLLKPSFATGVCADEGVSISESRHSSISWRLSEIERKIDIFLQSMVLFEAVKPKSRSTNKRNALLRARRMKEAAASKQALEVASSLWLVEPLWIVEEHKSVEADECKTDDIRGTPEDHGFVAESGDSVISAAEARKQLSKIIRADQKRFCDLKRCLFNRKKPEPEPKEVDPIHSVKVAIGARNVVTPHIVNGRNFEIGITTKTTHH
jgi:hypothetical protein